MKYILRSLLYLFLISYYRRKMVYLSILLTERCTIKCYTRRIVNIRIIIYLYINTFLIKNVGQIFIESYLIQLCFNINIYITTTDYIL